MPFTVVNTWLNYFVFFLPKLEMYYLIYRVAVEIRKYAHSDDYLSWNPADVQQTVVTIGEKLYERLLESSDLAGKSGFQVRVSD